MSRENRDPYKRIQKPVVGPSRAPNCENREKIVASDVLVCETANRKVELRILPFQRALHSLAGFVRLRGIGTRRVVLDPFGVRRAASRRRWRSFEKPQQSLHIPKWNHKLTHCQIVSLCSIELEVTARRFNRRVSERRRSCDAPILKLRALIEEWSWRRMKRALESRDS